MIRAAAVLAIRCSLAPGGGGAASFSGRGLGSGYAPNAQVPFARRNSQQAISTQEEVWKYWQFGGLSMDAIAEKMRLNKENVVEHLVAAIEMGKPIDWIALCKEVDLSISAANEMSDHLPVSRQQRTAAFFRKMSASCPKLTKEQICLCVVMLDRGLSFDDIKAVASAETGYSTDVFERLRIASAELRRSRKIKKEFFRITQGKLVLLDQGLMDLLRYRDGASLLEIAAFFSDCDQKQLVDLLYELEKAGAICSVDGKYREVHIPIF